MFRVYYINFSYFADGEWATLQEAVAYAKCKCFQSTIYRGENMVAFWCPLAGLRLVEIVLGPQEPPSDPMIFNRRQPDGTFRPLAEFFDAHS